MANETKVKDNAAQGAEVTNENEVNVFSQLMGGEVAEQDKTREEIVDELLVSPNCRLVKGLTVRNVVENVRENHAFLTFVVKENVVGDVRDTSDLDEFGQPKIKLGRTHNVITSSYAVAGVMKDTPKMAIFAPQLVADPSVANKLFAGCKIDVLLQFVAANTEYTNPFASNPEPTTFDRDHVIHHIVGLSLGEVGEDMYHATLLK